MEDINKVLEEIKKNTLGQVDAFNAAQQQRDEKSDNDKIEELINVIKQKDELINKYQTLNQELFLKVGGDKIIGDTEEPPHIKTEDEMLVESAMQKIQEMNAQVK